MGLAPCLMRQTPMGPGQNRIKASETLAVFRRFHEVDIYQNAVHLAELGLLDGPAFALRPHAARRAARWFKHNFPGRCLYAVKANPAPWLIAMLAEEGFSFDVASIDEARRVREIAPRAMLGFMHPVKSPAAIREAYFRLGIRTFSLDTDDELHKIMAATDGARDLTLCVRLGVSSQFSKISLASKFGASPEEAPALLQAVRARADSLGVCFHVGSQAMTANAYLDAMDRAERAIVAAGVIVDVVDVGGGFPAPYPGLIASPLADYVRTISERFESMLVSEGAELWCEPGRALSAESASLIVRVEGRKGDKLYFNDGVYGALFDAGTLDWPYPVRRLRQVEGPEAMMEFSAFGPTCDDHDAMKGPFLLPADTQVGDFIEIGMLGAYGGAMATRFNGFGEYQQFGVSDEPMLTAYGAMRAPAEIFSIRKESLHG